MTWNNLTVEQYQILAPILVREDLTNLDRLVEVISVCESLPIEDIDSWPLAKLKEKEREYSFLYGMDFDKSARRHIDCNGKRYKFVYEVQKLPAARYIETKHFGNDVTGNLHKIMACCVMPMKKTLFGWKVAKYDARDHEAYSNDLKKARFVDVYNCVVFFCDVYRGWMHNSQDFLVKQFREIMTESQATALVQSFSDIMDGFIMPKPLQSTKESH